MPRTKQTARPAKKTPSPIGGLRVKYAHAKARCKIRKQLWKSQEAIVAVIGAEHAQMLELCNGFAAADELPSTTANDSYLTGEIECKKYLLEQLNDAKARKITTGMRYEAARTYRATCKSDLRAHPDYGVVKANKKARARSEAHVDALLKQGKTKAAGKTPAVLTLCSSE